MNGGVRVEHATCGCVSKGAGAGIKWSAHSKMGTKMPGLVPSADDTIPFISREGGEASRLAHNQGKVSSILTPATIWHVNNLDCCVHCNKEYGCAIGCNCRGQQA